MKSSAFQIGDRVSLRRNISERGRIDVVANTKGGHQFYEVLLDSGALEVFGEHELHAEVLCYRGVADYPRARPSVEDPCVTHFETFPDTPVGVKDAFEFLKSSVQYLSRRGFCEGCLQQEPPKKRIRLQSCDVCGECLLKRALA